MSGEWFIWLSHDDVLEENFVSTAISVCGEFDVVSQYTLHIDEIGNYLKFQSIVTSLKYKNAIKNFSNLYMLTLSGEFSFNGCALMIRKEVLQEHHGFQIAFKYIQDYIFWIEMILNERRFYFLDRIGVYNRIHKRQQSHNKELLETESTLFFLNSEEILLNNKRFNKVMLYSSLAIYSNRINNVFLRKYFVTKLFRINIIAAIITAIKMYIYRVMLFVYKTLKV